ncbi:MAG: lipoate--protein ligase [Velocimicrobium sp.]
MIRNIQYMNAIGFDPYQNLAMEEYLLEIVEKDTCILYLWQNENTVVIGRNQNPWKECKIEELKQDGGHLVRRLSGGGAVFHDLGNLNFTFLLHKDNYDLEKQLEVILRGVKKFGIQAEKSGRNDITVSGKKFSGNAFYTRGNHCYHHGTLLVHADIGKLSNYLQVSKEKLCLKGIDSVRSRVGNLSDYGQRITIVQLKESLLEAFGEIYGIVVTPCESEDFDKQRLEEGKAKFSSWDWIYGRNMEFQHEKSKQFIWGNTIWQFQVNRGRIEDLQLFSDSVESDLIEKIPNYMKGCKYEKEAVCKRLHLLSVEGENQSVIKKDLETYFAGIEW